jgi:hypothetical protein
MHTLFSKPLSTPGTMTRRTRAIPLSRFSGGRNAARLHPDIPSRPDDRLPLADRSDSTLGVGFVSMLPAIARGRAPSPERPHQRSSPTFHPPHAGGPHERLAPDSPTLLVAAPSRTGAPVQVHSAVVRGDGRARTKGAVAGGCDLRVGAGGGYPTPFHTSSRNRDSSLSPRESVFAARGAHLLTAELPADSTGWRLAWGPPEG